MMAVYGLSLWTDGSVVWNNVFWLTTGDFAVVLGDGSILAHGEVKHWVMNSYIAELWPLLQAVVHSTLRIPTVNLLFRFGVSTTLLLLDEPCGASKTRQDYFLTNSLYCLKTIF